MVELLPFAPIGNPLDTTAQVTAVKDGTTRTMEIILTETKWSTLFLYMAQSACAPKRFESMRLALIALKTANIIVASPATLVTLGDLHSPQVLLAVAGFFVPSEIVFIR